MTWREDASVPTPWASTAAGHTGASALVSPTRRSVPFLPTMRLMVTVEVRVVATAMEEGDSAEVDSETEEVRWAAVTAKMTVA